MKHRRLVAAALMGSALVFTAVGVVSAQQRALSMLDGATRLQASVMAFNDTFWITATLIVCTLPLVVLLGRPATGAKLAGGH